MPSAITAFFKPTGASAKRKRDEENTPTTSKRAQPDNAAKDGGADPPTAGDPPRAADGADAAQGSKLTGIQAQRMRANKHMAIITQRVNAMAKDGQQPALPHLLVEESWLGRLRADFKRDQVQSLQRFLHTEWASKKIFPPKQMIFRALNSVPFEDVRVVVIGQDPYHDDGQAMGWSFSVPSGCKVPSSLQNIYKEAAADVGISIPKHGNLEKWVLQGVLMLNTSLTVQAHTAGSHSKKGWEGLTDAMIKKLSADGKHIVFLLWGKHAQNKGKVVDRSKHLVLECAHPSGLSAHRGFFGCKHFSKTNEYLEKHGREPIDWQIE